MGINASIKVEETGDPEAKTPEGPEKKQQSNAPPAKEQQQPSVATNSGQLPIMLTVRGGELSLYDPHRKKRNVE